MADNITTHFQSTYRPASSSQEPAQPATNARIQSLSKLYSHQLSDMGNAHRFVAQFGHQLRFVPARGWFLYNGTRWILDETNQVLELAYASLQTHYDQANALSNRDQALCERILAHIEHCQSHPRLKALLLLATALPGISLPASAFNSDPFLLNFLNGTLDLRTRTLHPHQPSDYLTQLILTPYTPDATSSVLTAFLARFTNHNPDLLTYLQRAIGYSLTGFTSEHACFLLTGPSQTAQSFFLTLLSHLFASYCVHLPTFQRRQLSPTLLDARLLTTSTSTFLQDSDPLLLTTFIEAESCTLAPSSPVSSTYRPQATIWASLPNPPQLNSRLSHLRDRLKFLPISYQMSTTEARHLEQQLRDLLPALLAWAVQGALHWLDSDLCEPSIVTQASLDYLEEQDGLSSFFETRCIRGLGYHIAAHELYQAYLLWCHHHHLSPLTENTFGRTLIARNFTRVRHSDCRTYYGLALVDPSIISSATASTPSASPTPSTSSATAPTSSTSSKPETSSIDSPAHLTSPTPSTSPKPEIPLSAPPHHPSPIASIVPTADSQTIRSANCPNLFGDLPTPHPNSPPTGS